MHRTPRPVAASKASNTSRGSHGDRWAGAPATPRLQFPSGRWWCPYPWRLLPAGPPPRWGLAPAPGRTGPGCSPIRPFADWGSAELETWHRTAGYAPPDVPKLCRVRHRPSAAGVQHNQKNPFHSGHLHDVPCLRWNCTGRHRRLFIAPSSLPLPALPSSCR